MFSVNNSDIRFVINKEYKGAVDLHPKFHSQHEAWAVLAEEVDELGEDYKGVIKNLGKLWEAVKMDEIPKAQLELVENIYSFAHDCILEGIQVAAVALKFQDFLLNIVQSEPDVTEAELVDENDDFDVIEKIFRKKCD